MVILFCSYIKKTYQLDTEPFHQYCCAPCIDVLYFFFKLAQLKILLKNMSLVQSPSPDLGSLPFCFSLVGTKWHSNLLWSFVNAECETGSVVRRYQVAQSRQFRITRDTQGGNARHQHSVCLVCEIPAIRQEFPCHCYGALHPKIILFLIGSFYLCPSPLSSVLYKIWKALRYRTEKSTCLKMYLFANAELQ